MLHRCADVCHSYTVATTAAAAALVLLLLQRMQVSQRTLLRGMVGGSLRQLKMDTST